MSNTTANILGVTMLFIMMFIVIMANINREERADWRTSHQRAVEADMVAKWVERHKQPRHTPQQQALYEVWNLTEADVAKPVDLWGTK